MRKYLLGILLGVSILIGGCSNSKNDNENIVTNYFNGEGELHSYSEINRSPILYDDKYIYINLSGHYCIDDDSAYLVCNDASCKHEDSSCIASWRNKYFTIDKNLYCCGNQIINCDTKEVVYENKLPKEYEENKEISYENYIDDIRVMNDKYIVLREGGYCMVLDTNFNEITYFDGISARIWYSIKDDYLYFLNCYYKIEKVSLVDGKTENIDLGIPYIINACDDEKYYFVQDRYGDLFRIDKETKEKKKIISDVSDFAVIDKYLYYGYSDEDGVLKQVISDKEGNIIKEMNALEDIGGTVNLYSLYFNGKLYIGTKEINDKSYIVEMSLDGSEIKKYEVRD